MNTSKADRLERGIEELQEILGDIRDPELEAQAEALLQRAINGEISMPDDPYRSADKNIYSTVARLTEEEVDEYLQDLPETLEAAKKGISEFHIYFGSAVGEADGFYYAVFIEEVPTGWGPR